MDLLKNYLSGFTLSFTTFDKKNAVRLYRTRNPFAHKNDFGHVLLLAGSRGKIGAALMAAKACLRSGAGLLTAHIPACGDEILQGGLPEAMVSMDDGENYLTSLPEKTDSFQAAGVGPGIGTHDETSALLRRFLGIFQSPLVLDADALNLLAKSPDLMKLLTPDTILTPHAGEFDRLFGTNQDEMERFQKAREAAVRHQILIVLKGHFTGVFYPDGTISFNTSGNAGMAKGGSGDVLTCILTALLAQGYPAKEAAPLGVYLHGAAGDLAAEKFSEESMLPGDLTNCIGSVFLDWKKIKSSTK